MRLDVFACLSWLLLERDPRGTSVVREKASVLFCRQGALSTCRTLITCSANNSVLLLLLRSNFVPPNFIIKGFYFWHVITILWIILFKWNQQEPACLLFLRWRHSDKRKHIPPKLKSLVGSKTKNNVPFLASLKDLFLPSDRCCFSLRGDRSRYQYFINKCKTGWRQDPEWPWRGESINGRICQSRPTQDNAITHQSEWRSNPIRSLKTSVQWHTGCTPEPTSDPEQLKMGRCYFFV